MRSLEEIQGRHHAASQSRGSPVKSEIYVGDVGDLLQAHAINKVTIERLGQALMQIRSIAVMNDDRAIIEWCDKALSPAGSGPAPR